MMQAKNIILLIALIALVVPITATPEPSGVFWSTDTTQITSDQTTAYNYAADPGYAITNVVFDIPIDSSVSYTLTYGNGSTVSGTCAYTAVNLIYSRSVVSISSDTQTREFVDAHTSQTQLKITGYAKDEEAGTTGFGIWDSALGLWSDQIAYFAVPNGTNRLISNIAVTSNKPIKVTLGYGKAEDIANANNKTAWDTLKDWVAFAISLAGMMIGVLINIAWWLKFFFVDNFLLICALYISVSMAYAAISSVGSRGFDVFRFYKKFIGFQQSMFKFVMELWNMLVTIISQFASIFKLV